MLIFRRKLFWLAVSAALFASLAVSSLHILPSRAADDSPDSPASVQAVTDSFGIAHISAVNGQVPTYSSQRYQQAVAEGATWNRWVFYWHDIEQSYGNPDYSPQEATVNADVANGFRYKIDAVLMGTPVWATTAQATAAGTTPPPPRVGEHRYADVTDQMATGYSGPSPAVYPPQNLDRSVFSDGTDVPGAGKAINQSNYWARYVYNTVNRFKDRVRHWEVWNEPDYYPSVSSGWYGFWYGSPDQYFRLLKVAYLAAKSADSNAVILMGGMAYWPEIVQRGHSPFAFFQRVLDDANGDALGGSNNRFFDVTPWHWYNRSNQSYYMVQQTRNVLISRGLSSKPIWLNESGLPVWNDSSKPPPGGNHPYFGSGTMTEQASYVLQALAYGLAAGVQRTFIFQEYDDGNGEAFGLVRNDGNPRPAYQAYQLASRYLSNISTATLVEQGSVSIVTASPSSGGRVVALWNNSPTPTLVNLTARTATATLVWQPTESNPSGTQQTITSSGGQYSITMPGATDNNGTSNTDYIVGGLVALVVEGAGGGGGGAPPPLSGGLIANGSFEQIPPFTGWHTAMGYLSPQLATSPAGGNYAVLGANYSEHPSLGGANSTLSQVVTLPSGAGPLSLNFSYLLNTNQPPPGDIGNPYTYDKFESILIDQSGNRHDLLVDATGKVTWTKATIDITVYRGQQVTFIFNVWQSAATTNYPTTTYLDSVRIWPFVAQLSGMKKNAN